MPALLCENIDHHCLRRALHFFSHHDGKDVVVVVVLRGCHVSRGRCPRRTASLTFFTLHACVWYYLIHMRHKIGIIDTTSSHQVRVVCGRQGRASWHHHIFHLSRYVHLPLDSSVYISYPGSSYRTTIMWGKGEISLASLSFISNTLDWFNGFPTYNNKYFSLDHPRPSLAQSVRQLVCVSAA